MRHIMPQKKLELKDFQYQSLFHHDGLQALDARFLTALQTHDSLLQANLLYYRQGKFQAGKEQSEMLIACSEFLDRFLADLFQIQNDVHHLFSQTIEDDPIFEFKKQYVLREAKRILNKPQEFNNFAQLNQWLKNEIKSHKLNHLDGELATAILGKRWLATQAEMSARLVNWCVLAMTPPEGQHFVKEWVSFHFPEKLDFADLFPIEATSNNILGNDTLGREQMGDSHLRARDSFHLTDERMSRRQVMDEIHYCVYCHKNDGDFCSKGFPVKRNNPELGLKKNPLGEVMTGCPLEEKISEMHVTKKNGYGIGALAIV